MIDDDAILLKLARSMLEQLGIETILSTQHSGEAFETFRANQQTIDVVLCDWNMPDMSGIDLKIVRAPAGRRLRYDDGLRRHGQDRAG